MDAQEKWDRLGEQDQQQLLDTHRWDAPFQDWYECIFEVFKEQMDAIGIHVERCYFSGFGSQGDGACFSGWVSWPLFISAFGRPDLASFVREHESALHLGWNQSGRYCHENCVSFTDELDIENPYDEDEAPLRHEAWNILHATSGPIAPLLDDFKEYLRGRMRGLYRGLEDEHDWLTSDKNTLDYILENHEDQIDHLLKEAEENNAETT